MHVICPQGRCKAKATGKSISQLAEHLLVAGLARRRDKDRDPEVRALCFLFRQVAKRVAFPPVVGPDDVIPRWRTNPFLFEDGKVFKEGDDLMCAVRYALMMLRNASTEKSYRDFRRPLQYQKLSIY